MDAELRDWVIEVEGVEVLRHPLIIEIMPIGGLCNRRLRHKRALLSLPSYSSPSRRIFLYERPFRLDKICEWVDEACEVTEDLREALALTWVDMESDDADPGIVEMCVGAFRKAGFITQRPDIVASPGEGAALTLYRGGSNPLGMGWSTSYDVARWFAERYLEKDRKPTIWEGRCAADGVLAYLTARKESEIVCDPARIRGLRRTPLAPR